MTKKEREKQGKLVNDEYTKEYHLEAVEKIIENSKKSDFYKAEIIHRELLNRGDGLAKIISEIKAVQWKIVNYAVLLFAAIIGIFKIIKLSYNDNCTLVIQITIYLLLICAVIWFSIRMFNKTEKDFEYYREHSRLNEQLLRETTGILYHAIEYIRMKNKNLRDRPDFKKSAIENRDIYSKSFYIIIIVSGILSILLVYYLIFIETK
jgi:hypothetical protein